VTLRAAQRLAVQAHRLPVLPPGLLVGPPADRPLEGPAAVQRREQVVQRRAARRHVAREPQRPRELLAPVPAELRDGIQAAGARQHRHGRERENRLQRVPSPRRVARIGHLPERLVQRKRLRHNWPSMTVPQLSDV
jgi:hypothetical protein